MMLLVVFVGLLGILQTTPATFAERQRREVIAALSTLLVDRYVDPAVGIQVAGVLREKMNDGGFSALNQPDAFAAAVNDVLQRETRDRHLWIWHAQGAAAQLQFAAIEGPMVRRADLLPGEIGYIEVLHFVGNNTEFDSAMEKLRTARAIVVDLRLCVGGNRDQVNYLSSYFFSGPTRLIARQARTDASPIEQRTVASLPGQRFPDVPVYVLTSRRTFSAAEGFALGLHVNGRAVIVGEQTGGGGHFVQGFPALPHGFVALLAVGRNLDPRSGASWEGAGIAPDVVVTPELALQAAIGHFHGWRR